MIPLFFLLIQATIIHSTSLDLYVSYNQTAIQCDDNLVDKCGSSDSPFSSLLQSFYFIDKNSKELLKYNSITIFLTNRTYVIDVFSVSSYLDKLNLANQEKETVWKIFKGLSGVNITITPLNNKGVTKIFIKTLVFSFKLNGMGLFIMNVTLDGTDIDYRFAIQSPTCLYWEIGCCVNVCRSLIVTKYQGIPSFLIEVLGMNNFVVLEDDEIINMNLNYNYASQNIHISSFIYVNTLMSTFIKISNSRFFNINFKSFFIGTMEKAAGDFRNNQLIIYFKNNSFQYFDKSRPLGNSTFKLMNAKKASFIDCQFSYINTFMSFNGENFEMENCSFVNKMSDYDLYYIYFESSYSVVFRNVTFTGGISTARFLNVLSSSLFITSMIVNELTYFDENPIMISSNLLKFTDLHIFFNSKAESIVNTIHIISSSNGKALIIRVLLVNLNKDSKIIWLSDYKNVYIDHFLLRGITSNPPSNIKFKVQSCKQIVFSRHIYYGAALELQESGSFILAKSYFTISFLESETFFSILLNSKVMVRSCLFDRFSSRVKGATFSLQALNYFMISKSIFYNLMSLQSGSMLFASSMNKMRIIDSFILNAQSLDSGGVVSILSSNELLIENSLINDYKTVNFGGFLLVSENENHIKIFNCSFINGAASEGPVLFFNFESQLWINYSLFCNNSADFDGGAFKFNIQNDVVIENSIIKRSESLELAGVMSAFKGNRILIRLTIMMNSSATSVSLFNIKLQNRIDLQSVYIMRSDSKEYGGGIKLMSQNQMIISNTYFYNITSQRAQKLISIGSQNAVSIQKSLFHNSFSSSGLASLDSENRLLLKENSYINSGYLKVIGSVLGLSRSNNYLYFLKTSVFYGDIETFISSEGANFIEVRDWRIDIMTFSYFFDLNRNDSLLCHDFVYLLKEKGEKPSVLLNSLNSRVKLHKCSIINRSKQSFRLGYLLKSKAQINNLQIVTDEIFHNEKQVLEVDFSFIIISKSKTVKIGFIFNSSFVYVHESVFFLNERKMNSSVISYISDGFNVYKHGLKLIIRKCVFASDRAEFGGAISINLSEKSDMVHAVVILNSIFRNNEAKNGGTFYSHNLDVAKIRGNRFISNTGVRSLKGGSGFSKGGAFFLQASRNMNLIQFYGNDFENNRANIGGIIYSEGTSGHINKNEFLLNQSNTIKNYANYYGDDLASNIVRFSQLDSSNQKTQTSQQFFLHNLVSGRKYTECLLNIYFQDIYSNIASKTNEDLLKVLTIYTPNPSSLDLQLQNNEGSLCLKGVFKNYLHLYSHNYSFVLTYLNSSIEIYYSFRPCERGEKLLEDFSCQYCPKNFYSSWMVNEPTECLLCSSSLPFICYGGNNLTVKQSFWRITTYSMNIIKCLNVDACYGDDNAGGLISERAEFNSSYRLSTCALGYKGPLCAACEEGFGFGSRYKCEKCTDRYFILKMAGFLVMQLGFMAFAMYKSLSMSRMLFLDIVDERHAITMNLIKIFSSHAQLLVIIFSMNGSSNNFLSIFESNPFNTNISDNFSIQCVFQALHIEVYYLYSKIGITLFSLLICFILAVIVLKLMMIKHHESFNVKSSQRKRRKLMFFDLIESVIFIVCVFHSPNIIRDVLEMFIFINIEDHQSSPNLRVLMDVEIVYDSAQHVKMLCFLAIPLLFLFGLLLPFFLFARIRGKKKVSLLNDSVTRFNYGYFFFSYKDDKLYWELISNLRKVVIQGVVVAGTSLDSNRKDLCFLIILCLLMLFLYSAVKIKPFKEEYDVLNSIEESSFIILGLSTFLLIGFKFNDQNDISIGLLSPSNIFFMILILINAAFYALFLWIYLKYGKLEERIFKYLPSTVRKSRTFTNFQQFMKGLFSPDPTSPTKPIKLPDPPITSKSNHFLLIFNQDITSTFLPYLKKLKKRLERSRIKIRDLRLEVLSLKKEQDNSYLNMILTHALPFRENSYFVFYEKEVKLEMKAKIVSVWVKYKVRMEIGGVKISRININLENRTKKETTHLFDRELNGEVINEMSLSQEKFSMVVHQKDVLQDFHLQLILTEEKLVFPLPVLIKSLLSEIEAKLLPNSFEFSTGIENKFSFYRTFPTKCKSIKRLFSLFNVRIGRNKERAPFWAKLNVIDGSKILIIFKRESDTDLKAFLYLDNFRKEKDRASELLIQTLSSEKEDVEN